MGNTFCAFHPWHPGPAWSKGILPLKTCLIFNPRSGGAARAQTAVRAFAAHHGARLRLTERPRHAGELAAQALAEGCELIAAVGGDGTLNEVAAVLTGTGATFGLVPCGSGNGLGRELGIHGSITRALAILVDGSPRLIDSGLADGHPFFVVAGLGFEATIADRFNRLPHRGALRYLLLSARTFASWSPETYTITHGTSREQVRAFTLAVANSPQYGNQARIAPEAQLDDGQLDLCAIPPISPWNAAPLVWRLFAGTLDCSAQVTLRRGDRFVVERAAPGLLHTDGEVHAAGTRVEFLVRPASLRVLVPTPGMTLPR
jgi:diacylglycerol kinase family enzyme